jgi:CDP-diacylglycerol--serine O-phosphatidyltransferase
MSQSNDFFDTEVDEQNPRGKGLYLFPNLLTTGGLFAGFYAVVAAMNHLYVAAAFVTFIAMLMDSLDGRVARMTNTTSQFGAEYDSLSDMIAFGIAPALLVYSRDLVSLHKIGWLVAFIYVAATGLRLARFNTQLDNPEADKRFFSGLPCPAAAGFLASVIWIQQIFHISGDIVNIITAILTGFVAIMMVSNIPYHSFKKIDLKGKVPFVFMFLIILIFAVITLDPPKVLFTIFTVYVFSGPFAFIKNKITRSRHTAT